MSALLLMLDEIAGTPGDPARRPEDPLGNRGRTFSHFSALSFLLTISIRPFPAFPPGRF
jgi:hypothetical protein